VDAIDKLAQEEYARMWGEESHALAARVWGAGRASLRPGD